MFELPIDAILPDLGRALTSQRSAVLAAPPGSGKTTGVPPRLLGAKWMAGRSILLLEPRRLAARAAAHRMAELLGESVGRTIGFRTRFETRVSARTRIEVVTEGILIRRLQNDAELDGVGLVIFDEFHERSLLADLAMALVLDIRGALRPDLRLLVMSATLDTDALSRLLGAPVIVGEGRSHPVTVHYGERTSELPGVVGDVVKTVRHVLALGQGDVLVFLPGRREIIGAESALRPHVASDITVVPLYGDLPRQRQDAALRRDAGGRRRIVLATDLAESSLTIEGIGTVVDAGWVRRPRFRPATGLSRLETQRVSRASADQRAGRAGRLGPGRCYRLWTKSEHSRLPRQRSAEIRDADLTPLALELAAWGVDDPRRLSWLDPPPAAAMAQARDLLRRMDGLDEKGRITDLGRRMLGVSAHPRLARMLLAAAGEEERALACDLAALLSERDVVKALPGAPRFTDLSSRLETLTAWRAGHGRADTRSGADPAACRAVDRVAAQLRRQVGAGDRSSAPRSASAAGLLSVAYPERIARRRAGRGARYLLASGRGAYLPEGDPLQAHEWLVAAHLDAGAREGRIYLAAAADRAEIAERHRHHVDEVSVVRWDGNGQAVEQWRERRLGALVLSRAPLDRPDGDLVAEAMLAGVRRMGIECLPWGDAARDLQDRILSLRAWRPDEAWPDLRNERLTSELDRWLGPYLTGMTRRSHLARLDLKDILLSMLPWAQRERLDSGAPTHVKVPSGSRIRLRYQRGSPPVLAVKLQELFGLSETPRVCWGEVPVMLHLLSPARRPIQVTQDLGGFWRRTYPEVRKELKGRYPKHPWPEDPWTAPPTSGAKRRSPRR